VKALSLRQPWLWAVLELGKTIENRRWNSHYRGPILLHASMGSTLDECLEALAWMQSRHLIESRDPRWPGLKNVERGGICGYAELVDVVAPGPTTATVPREMIDELSRWHMPQQYGFVLRKVRRIPFAPCRGALGLFEVAPDVERAVRGYL